MSPMSLLAPALPASKAQEVRGGMGDMGRLFSTCTILRARTRRHPLHEIPKSSGHPRTFPLAPFYDNIVKSLKAMRKIRKAVRQHTVELRQLRESERQETLNEIALERAAESELPN